MSAAHRWIVEVKITGEWKVARSFADEPTARKSWAAHKRWLLDRHGQDVRFRQRKMPKGSPEVKGPSTDATDRRLPRSYGSGKRR